MIGSFEWIGISFTVIILYCISNWLIQDVFYYIRMKVIDLTSSQTIFNISDEYEEERYVWPTDIDRNGHMNNARYIYYLNFSRRLLFRNNGLWPLLNTNNLNCVIQSQTIRYRKELNLFQKYYIKSKILSYSDKDECIYIETIFENSNKFIAAIHHCKYRIVNLQRVKTNDKATRSLGKRSQENVLNSIDLTKPSILFNYSGLKKKESLTDYTNSSSINNNSTANQTPITSISSSIRVDGSHLKDSNDQRTANNNINLYNNEAENHPEFLMYWIKSQEISSKMLNPKGVNNTKKHL